MSSTADKISISGIDCVAAIGVTAEERTMQQRLSVDVELTTDVREASRSDRLKDALDYSKVVTDVVALAGSRDFHLIETLAEEIAARVLSDFDTRNVRVIVRKTTPVMASRVNFVSVEIERGKV